MKYKFDRYNLKHEKPKLMNLSTTTLWSIMWKGL